MQFQSAFRNDTYNIPKQGMVDLVNLIFNIVTLFSLFKQQMPEIGKRSHVVFASYAFSFDIYTNYE